MNFSQIATASLDELNDELAAAGWESRISSRPDARCAVARLLHETFGPFDLRDSETNENIRDATAAEAADCVSAGSEGHILDLDGRKCYVAE